jgi:hypothetical protein
MRTSIAVVVLLTLCAGVRAEEDADTSANSVFLGCKAFVEGQATNLRLNQLGNYCSGIVHGLAGVGEYLTPQEWQSCIPPTSTARQLARVVISYIEARPQRMHEDFRGLTLEAFRYAWPCKSGR